MSKIRKILLSKFRNLCFLKKGRLDVKILEKETNNVNEEYKEAFRTKSYIEICNKIRGEVDIRTSLDEGQKKAKLSDYLQESQQETLTPKLHPFLVNYLEISQEACKACELLLKNVHQLRANYRAMQHEMKFMIKQVPDATTSLANDQFGLVSKNLASFVLRMKPFSTMTPETFHGLHDRYALLFRKLTSQCRKTKRRSRFIRCMKRVLTTFQCMGWGALVMALSVLAMHTVVGLVAVVGLVLGSFYLFLIKKTNRGEGNVNKSGMERLGAQLDIAGRGVYIMINDFDTMSQMVQRVQDEMEHMKLVAGICVMRKWKDAALKVVREFQIHESCLGEELEDLEKQIYLCLLDINRSRRLLLQELTNQEDK